MSKNMSKPYKNTNEPREHERVLKENKSVLNRRTRLQEPGTIKDCFNIRQPHGAGTNSTFVIVTMAFSCRMAAHLLYQGRRWSHFAASPDMLSGIGAQRRVLTAVWLSATLAALMSNRSGCRVSEQ
jgi:hypothetical protein